MQNKGFIKFIAIVLTLICCFYMSFSVVTSHYDSKAAEMAKTDSIAAEAYLDSLNSHPCYLGAYNLKQCRETAVGLGLDLKGGMNVILEVSVPDVVKTLADHKTDPAFIKSIDEAKKESEESQSDFISLFVKAYKKNAPNSNLASIFATQQLKDKVNTTTSDKDVEKVLRKSVDEAVDNSFNVLRTRIDRFGVVQPNIQKVEGQTGRIMVELPGIKEPERVRKLLQGSANLEFWETYDTPEAVGYLSQLNNALRNGETAETEADSTKQETAEADSAKVDSAKAEADKLLSQAASNSEEKANKNKKTQNKVTEEQRKANPLYSHFLQIMSGDRGCMVGLALASDTAEIDRLLKSPVAKQILPSDMSLKWGVKPYDEAGRVYELYAIRKTGKNGRAPLEGECVTESKDEFDQYGRPCVTIKMNPEGSRIWSTITERNVGHCIAIVLDDVVYSAPNVQNKIDGGSTQITGSFTTNDTKDLANVLASGRMPAPAQIVQEDIVGPTLGAQSIQAGIIACIVAFILLIIYMISMYGFKAGMVANCALIFNFFFSFGILTSFGAALTLSGLAGMVLTLGMAVDANVLVFERTKEELRAGKNMKNAVDAGYSNAFSAIFDSNITTILTAIILYNFGTGPIKGFATTLGIGIVCSFFTAVWLTRIVFEKYNDSGKVPVFIGMIFASPIIIFGLPLIPDISIDNKFFKWTVIVLIVLVVAAIWYIVGYVVKFVLSLLMSLGKRELTFTTPLSKNLMTGTHFNFMGKYKTSFVIFGAMILIGAASLFVRGLSQSIDFTGGRNYKVVFVKPVQTEAVEQAIEKEFAAHKKGEDAVTVSVIAIGTDGKQVRVSTNYRIKESGNNVDEEIEESLYRAFVQGGFVDKNVTVKQFLDRDDRAGGSIISSQKVGPAVASDITWGAVKSVILALIVIFIYILIRFRNVAYSIGSISALCVDTFLVIGAFSLCYGWMPFSLEIDQTFIGAILTVVGYSINDKVVVFDRIRETFRNHPKRDIQANFNDSLNACLTRTVNTSVSTFVVLLAIILFAGDSIRGFAFAMILGVVIGTFSSLFVAAPIAYLVMGKTIKEDDAPAQA